MKADFVDVSDTQKTLTVEIPSDLVDAEIDRIAKGYARQARLPGFRPGKAPASVIKQRFRDQIHHDVMHGLIPKAVEAALTERGIEPVNTPNITNVAIHEGQPLTFTAAVETVPAFDPGDLSSIAVTRTITAITDAHRRSDAAAAARARRQVRAGRGAARGRRRHAGGRPRAHRCGRRHRAAQRHHASRWDRRRTRPASTPIWWA